jgi:anti-sigma factor RsiW
MSELEIPDAAYAAGVRAAAPTNPYDSARCKLAIDAAAPRIVAAAYRKFAEVLETYATEAERAVRTSATNTVPSQTPAGLCQVSDGREAWIIWFGRAFAYESAANMLHDEADKLEQ